MRLTLTTLFAFLGLLFPANAFAAMPQGVPSSVPGSWCYQLTTCYTVEATDKYTQTLVQAETEALRRDVKQVVLKRDEFEASRNHLSVLDERFDGPDVVVTIDQSCGSSSTNTFSVRGAAGTWTPSR